MNFFRSDGVNKHRNANYKRVGVQNDLFSGDVHNQKHDYTLLNFKG